LEDLSQELGLETPVVLTPDVGAVALTTDVSLIDMGGLGDAFIARNQGGSAFAQYVFDERRPDVITLHSTWIAATAIDDDVRLWRDYTPIGLSRTSAGGILTATFVRNDLVLVAGGCSDAVQWPDAPAIGSELTVRGFVVGSSTEQAVTFLRTAGHGGVGIAIREADQTDTSPPAENAYTGKTVCATGRVTEIDGSPVLLTQSPNAIIIDESPRVWTPLENAGGSGISQQDATQEEFEAVEALRDGALWGGELDAALSVHDVDYVVVHEDSLAAHALLGSVHTAQDFEARDGTPELALRSNVPGEPYSAWAFGRSERQGVGGQRFTIPQSFDPEDSRLGFVLELAPSGAASSDQTVRVVISYWEGNSGTVINAVTDVVLPSGTASGEMVATLRSPSTPFAPGEAYEFIVWREPAAPEDTYLSDVWFTGVRIGSAAERMERIAGTNFFVYSVAKLDAE
jgi:hypothetical protein